MTHPIDFDGIQAIAGRPWTALQLLDRSRGVQLPLTALVDTGADVTQIPEAAAQLLGLSLAGASFVGVNTAGGLSIVKRQRVEIEAFRRTVWVDVDFSVSGVTLVGRETLFAVGMLDAVGFEDQSLYVKY